VIGQLTPGAIEALLHEEIVGRIGYVDRRGFPTIVPITYAYDGRAFYGYSLLGAKIENMTANPRVCLEVDRIESAADWCSVMVRGTFEQLSGRAAVEAVEQISERLRTVAAATAAPAMAWRTFVTRTGGDGIAYRIHITQKHGRYSTSTMDG
jgi:uncharacterized protein